MLWHLVCSMFRSMVLDLVSSMVWFKVGFLFCSIVCFKILCLDHSLVCYTTEKKACYTSMILTTPHVIQVQAQQYPTCSWVQTSLITKFLITKFLSTNFLYYKVPKKFLIQTSFITKFLTTNFFNYKVPEYTNFLNDKVPNHKVLEYKLPELHSSWSVPPLLLYILIPIV